MTPNTFRSVIEEKKNINLLHYKKKIDDIESLDFVEKISNK